MTTDDDDPLVCPKCSNAVQDTDEFCPQCGEMFAEGVKCCAHSESEATGACIICAKPYCKECGRSVAGRFLCDHHSTYEIYEGMVRVYGVLEDVSAQYAQSCLEQAGLHPVLYCRRQPMGGPRFVYTLFSAGGDYDGHIVNEIKVMVPCQEVEQSEAILKTLDFTKPENAIESTD
jgi:hypothetical protein